MQRFISTDRVKYETDQGVAWVTIDRPEAMNAISYAVRVDLAAAFATITDDDSVQVAVLIGAGGRAFSAGADLKEVVASRREPGNDPGGPSAAAQALNALRDDAAGFPSGWEDVNACPKPVIAAIDGYCLAGGFELAMYCDLRVATKASSFGLPEVRRSMLAGPGLIHLARMIAPAEAMRIQLTGSPMTAERAYQIGFLQEVVEDRNQLVAAVTNIAHEITKGAPLALQSIKRIVKEGREVPIRDAMILRSGLARVIEASEDATEGPLAFAEKREPRWKSR